MGDVGAYRKTIPGIGSQYKERRAWNPDGRFELDMNARLPLE
jgi:hypothetical protein